MYTLVIYVRNIASGLDGVPVDVIEAANGMGYTSTPAPVARRGAAGRAA